MLIVESNMYTIPLLFTVLNGLLQFWKFIFRKTETGFLTNGVSAPFPFNEIYSAKKRSVKFHLLFWVYHTFLRKIYSTILEKKNFKNFRSLRIFFFCFTIHKKLKKSCFLEKFFLFLKKKI